MKNSPPMFTDVDDEDDFLTGKTPFMLDELLDECLKENAPDQKYRD